MNKNYDLERMISDVRKFATDHGVSLDDCASFKQLCDEAEGRNPFFTQDHVSSDGEVIHVELMYPSLPNNFTTVEVGLCAVRVADDVRISYDFDRDGWSIQQEAKFPFWEEGEAIEWDWSETAFVKARARKVPGPAEGVFKSEDGLVTTTVTKESCRTVNLRGITKLGISTNGVADEDVGDFTEKLRIGLGLPTGLIGNGMSTLRVLEEELLKPVKLHGAKAFVDAFRRAIFAAYAASVESGRPLIIAHQVVTAVDGVGFTLRAPDGDKLVPWEEWSTFNDPETRNMKRE